MKSQIAVIVALTISFGGLAAAQSNEAGRSSAKVESKELLQAESGVTYVLSPKGQHVAAAVLRGSRNVVVHDGVDGPKFDEIAPHSITFSPDGTRLGYLARLGQEWVYIVDGKEMARIPADKMVGANNATEFTPNGSNGTTGPTFTTNSRHVYFLVRTQDQPRHHASTFYFDGQPGILRATDPPLAPAFSPDGERYAYIHHDPVNAQQWTLIVDGKQAPWQGSIPRFTGDSKQLVTETLRPGGATEVQVDGKPWLRAAEVNVHIAPVTNLIVAAVKATPQDNTWFLHIGTQKVPGSEAQRVSHVFFSDDGIHWAAICQTAAGSHFMMIDGKKGLDYQNVEGIGFTSDGRFVYKATIAGNKQLIVHGEEESDAYQSIITSMAITRPRGNDPILHGTAPLDAVIAGNTVGFLANKGFSGDTTVVVINGKATPAKAPKELTFSPDGSRHAYLHGNPSAPVQVMVGGAPHQGLIHGPVINQVDQRFTFSPDGKHIAYAASSADGRTRGISIDGKFIPFAQLPAFAMHSATFTPDGKHLIWVAGLSGTQSAVYVDGLRAVEFSHNGLSLLQTDGNEPLEAKWSMGDDGVLTFIAEDGGSLKRFAITPGSDTSVDTLAQMTALK